MEIRNWLVMACLLVLFPTWIGTIWSYFIKLQGKLKQCLFCWVTGFLTIMAISQLILVPLVLRRYPFSTYWKLALVLYAVAAVLAVVLFMKRRKTKAVETEPVPEKIGKNNVWQVLFIVGAFGLILLQALISGMFQHIDDDDSRFVVEQVIAVEHNEMYKEHTVTGNMTYWNMGEMRKDMISPWAMQVAFWCKISGIAPAVLSHKYLPFFLILLCYAVYTLIGMHLFKDDKEKISIFLIFVSALNIYGYFSTHTTQAVLLLRIWQGKALVGAVLIPSMCYLMFEIMSRQGEKLWYVLAALCSMAAALASGSGITIMPVLVGAFGLAELFHTRKWKKALGIWCTAIPSVVYLLCYLFFWQVLKIYY